MSDKPAAQRRAEALFREKKYEEALEVYRGLHADLKEDKYLYNVAVCLYHLSQVGDAAAILEQLWSRRALAPDSGVFLGFCHRSLNQLGRGRQHFEAMIAETSGQVRGRCRLMVALLTDELGETDRAESLYEQLLTDVETGGKDRAEVYRRLATLKENRKDHLKALQLYRESLTQDPEGEGALAAKFRMAVCLMELSAPAESVDLLKDIETAVPGTFLGESAAKLRQAVESNVRRIERNIRSYE